MPRLDLLLLGMGPEGHVASIFPDSPAVDDERPVVAVRDCPKPPPTRVSLGSPRSTPRRRCWLLVSGEAKAAGRRPGAGRCAPRELPAAGVHGTGHPWLLDAAAAGSGTPLTGLARPLIREARDPGAPQGRRPPRPRAPPTTRPCALATTGPPDARRHVAVEPDAGRRTASRRTASPARSTGTLRAARAWRVLEPARPPVPRRRPSDPAAVSERRVTPRGAGAAG